MESISGNRNEKRNDNIISVKVEGIFVEVSTILESRINIKRIVNNNSMKFAPV
jgi:hypothetical protein